MWSSRLGTARGTVGRRVLGVALRSRSSVEISEDRIIESHVRSRFSNPKRHATASAALHKVRSRHDSGGCGVDSATGSACKVTDPLDQDWTGLEHQLTERRGLAGATK